MNFSFFHAPLVALLRSVSGLVRFCEAGGHQMMMTRFAIEAGEWEPQGGGFDWTGRVRQRYSALAAKGYRKAA
jgi:hypothetical protein